MSVVEINLGFVSWEEVMVEYSDGLGLLYFRVGKDEGVRVGEIKFFKV